jgi:prophage regulatory protein
MNDRAPSTPDDREDRLLPWSRVQDITGLSRTTAWRMQRSGDFPAPVPVSPGRVGWSESELTAWKAARKAGGRVRPAPFAKPRAPRLIETARSPKPEKTPAQVSTPQSAKVAAPGPIATASPVQVSLPLQPAQTDPARPAKRRSRAVSPDQIDFGF